MNLFLTSKKDDIVKKEMLSYLVALMLYGSNSIVASSIALSSYEIVFMRTLVASLFILAIFTLMRQKVTFLQHKRDAVLLFMSGAAMGACWLFIYEAYVRIGVSLATLACYCGPVLVMLAAPFVLRERLTPTKIVGLVVVMAGMALINGQKLLSGGDVVGLACGFMSALSYAVMVIAGKKATQVRGLERVSVQLVASFVVSAVYLLVKQGPVIDVTAASWLPILVLGIANTGLASLLYFLSMAKLPVPTVAVCGYLEPLTAVVLSVMLLGEHMGVVQIAGAALIVGGALFAELATPDKLPVRLRHRQSSAPLRGASA